MFGIIGKIILGMAARLPGEARAQTRYDSDQYGYITPSDGRIAGEAEMKDIREYNEKVAKDISERDKLMDDLMKDISPIHSSVGGFWRDGHEFMNQSRKMNTHSLMAQEGHSPKPSQTLQMAGSTRDFLAVENKVAGVGAVNFSDNGDIRDSASDVPLLHSGAVFAQTQALIQAMAAFSPVSAGQTLFSMQETTRPEALLVADGR